MSYHPFTTLERGRIQELLTLGYSHRTIAQKLDCHRFSIEREVGRNTAEVRGRKTFGHWEFSMEKAIITLYATLPRGAFKTDTTDRVKKFDCYVNI